jgi:NAD(P)-dependent dehydrogenase (short-subunit alcohol dehydrogenase family)
MQQQSLEGRRAVITGGGRGIGRAIAIMFAQAGADVAVTARSDNEIKQVADEVTALGRCGVAITCDVTDPDSIKRMAEQAVEGLGGVDILINNAGFGYSHKLVNHPDDAWHDVIATNLTSIYYVTKALLPEIMKRESGGRIINIASIASKAGAKYMTAYTASKHGVLGFTRALAAELMTNKITVNAICPGYVDTPMTDKTIAGIQGFTGQSAEQARQYLEKLSPQNRLIESDEIAALSVYLASDIAYGITGQAINIDGGALPY